MRKQRSEEYRGFRTAGIRLSAEIAPGVESHRTEKVSAMLYAIHRFDKAHLVMLTEEGLIPREDGVAMLSGLREMEAEGIEQARMRVQGGSHSGEQYLIRKLGEEVGGRIHLARSSGDLGAVSNQVYWRDQLLLLIESINRYRAVLLEVAADHIETVMPGYTHGQSAQPTTFGHQLLAWERALARDVDRARGAYEHVNISPAGAAIMTGSNFPTNRFRTAELLGFEQPAINTFDAILQHDDELEVAAVLAIHTHSMARMAEDLMIWSTAEFGMIEVPDRFCGTSSIMMQKKNPYAPQEIKGVGGEMLGGLVTTFSVEKGPTGMPIIDRKYGHTAISRGFEYARRDLDWMIEILPAIQVKSDVMEQRAGAFWGQATDVAGALVSERGLPWRSAHQIVGILVRFTYERGLTPQDVTPELLDEAAIEYFGEPVRLSNEALQAALDPENFVRTRTLYGGPGPDEVRRRLPDYQASLRSDQQWLAGQQAWHEESAQRLETAIDELINSAS